MADTIERLPLGTDDAEKLEDARNRAPGLAERVAVDNGPAGTRGFRSGRWTIRYGGRTFSVYASVPHKADIPTQRRQVAVAAARALIIGGYA